MMYITFVTLKQLESLIFITVLIFITNRNMMYRIYFKFNKYVDFHVHTIVSNT